MTECLRCQKPLTQVQQWNHARYCSENCSNKHKQEVRKADLKPIQVWACGGGVQSTAIAALIVMGQLPKPEYSWIVDVGWERSSTWAYVHDTLIPKLADVGVELNILRTTDYSDNSIVKDGHCTLPAYRRVNGTRQKLDTHCSNGWKRAVANKWLREHGVERCDTWLGISVDEMKRVRRSTTWWNQNRYPLVEMGFDRGRCQWVIGKLGWPPAPRTSCYFCPSQSDAAWLDLRRNWPDDFAHAAGAEWQIQQACPDVFLHETCQPLESVRFRQEDRLQMECHGSDRFCWSG